MHTDILFADPNTGLLADADLSKAMDVICRGGLVAFPTETVYGLGADGKNADACRKIFAAKGRPADNPLILHVECPADAEQYAYTCVLYYRLADRFMPGPLTVILPANDAVPASVTAGLGTVAIRCPAHPIAHQLIKACKTAIAAPSANLSGSPSPTCSKYVLDDMNGRIDMVICGDDSEIGLESTIVKIVDDAHVVLLRPGAITVEMLRDEGIDVQISHAVLSQLGKGEKAESPGMKYKHYAPKANVILLDGDDKSRQNYVFDHSTSSAVMCYNEELEAYTETLGKYAVYDLGMSHDTDMHAHRLFTLLREADRDDIKTIYIPLPNREGMGLALYNRLIRAAANQIIKL